jgi:molybdopterin synthase sulfur carrier subunit
MSELASESLVPGELAGESSAARELASGSSVPGELASDSSVPGELAGEPSGARERAGEPSAARELARVVIRVVLPAHLRRLARVEGEVALELDGAATQRAVLDALEARYPVLRGTVRDHATGQRRAFVRFFACEEDLSHESPDAPLPDAVIRGREPFLVVGAMAGG